MQNRLTWGVAVLLACGLAAPGQAADMTQQRMHSIIQEAAGDAVVAGNMVRFTFDGVELLCVSDVAADRMRIISPIVALDSVDSEQMLLALMANFHSVLDARYAVSDGVLYAAYIHPLSPLADTEVVAAISQVATAARTYGGSYTSGELFFGGGRSAL